MIEKQLQSSGCLEVMSLLTWRQREHHHWQHKRCPQFNFVQPKWSIISNCHGLIGGKARKYLPPPHLAQVFLQPCLCLLSDEVRTDSGYTALSPHEQATAVLYNCLHCEIINGCKRRELRDTRAFWPRPSRRLALSWVQSTHPAQESRAWVSGELALASPKTPGGKWGDGVLLVRNFSPMGGCTVGRGGGAGLHTKGFACCQGTSDTCR